MLFVDEILLSKLSGIILTMFIADTITRLNLVLQMLCRFSLPVLKTPGSKDVSTSVLAYQQRTSSDTSLFVIRVL